MNGGTGGGSWRRGQRQRRRVEQASGGSGGSTSTGTAGTRAGKGGGGTGGATGAGGTGGATERGRHRRRHAGIQRRTAATAPPSGMDTSGFLTDCKQGGDNWGTASASRSVRERRDAPTA